MMFPEAQRTLEQFLSPLSLDEFLDRVLTGGFRKIDGNPAGARTGLLGADPESLLLGAWQLAPKLTFHSANASGPAPSLESVAGAADFQQRIAEFHARNYSVRFPELRPLSPDLDRLARALEMVLHKPVTASAFWSRGGMRAPVHYDDHDLLVVQLRGTKRWYVGQQPSELKNTWSSMGERKPNISPHLTLDAQPGDIMYLPRGTYHSVDSDMGSLHVSIGFTPLTVREALIAAVDHLSDLDRGWRTTIGSRIAYQLRGAGADKFMTPIGEAAAALLAACRTPGFLASALQARSGRAIAALNALPAPDTAPTLTLDSELVQNELAFCHLTASPESIDVSYPGGHLFVHRGAQACVEYIVNAQRFRVRDIPGELGDDIRLTLARRFVEIGFLRLADSRAQRTQTAAA
ncbi:MAG TPA: cupin domain-containing protein [Steroidobacteraceae bacterium]|nr:cupin domain-containing protein [Steroidobacteraceae bacterium]